jgi:hypothetical protein
MAIFYLRCERIKRAQGKSMVGRAAYTSGSSIYDKNKKRSYSYNGRQDVLTSHILLPYPAPLKFFKRRALWNEAENKERGKKTHTGFEIIVAIPHELSASGASDLIHDYASFLANHLKCAVDASIHTAREDSGHHDKRNIHAHILLSKRKVGEHGFLDELTALRKKSFKYEMRLLRKIWAAMANQALKTENIDERIDPRSLKDQGIDRIPQIPVGKKAKYLYLKGLTPHLKKKRARAPKSIMIAMAQNQDMNLTKRSKR